MAPVTLKYTLPVVTLEYTLPVISEITQKEKKIINSVIRKTKHLKPSKL